MRYLDSKICESLIPFTLYRFWSRYIAYENYWIETIRLWSPLPVTWAEWVFMKKVGCSVTLPLCLSWDVRGSTILSLSGSLNWSEKTRAKLTQSACLVLCLCLSCSNRANPIHSLLTIRPWFLRSYWYVNDLPLVKQAALELVIKIF